MKFDEAKAFTEELGVIGGFPSWSGPAVCKIAEFVQSACRTPAEARRLVDRAVTTYSRWDQCGIPGLRSLLAEAREGEVEEWQPDYSQAEPIYCRQCSDTGAHIDGPTLRWVACGCPAGDVDYAADLNRVIDEAAQRKHSRISAEERARMLAAILNPTRGK